MERFIQLGIQHMVSHGHLLDEQVLPEDVGQPESLGSWRACAKGLVTREKLQKSSCVRASS